MLELMLKLITNGTQIRAIETVYCEYCKHNEAALMRVSEFVAPDGPARTKQFLKV
jgi:hypothetical protein